MAESSELSFQMSCQTFNQSDPAPSQITCNESTKKRGLEKCKHATDGGYVNQSGKIIRGRKFKHSTDCCNKICHKRFTRVDQETIFLSFWCTENKDKQDTFLLSCVTRKTIKHSKQFLITKNRLYSWQYSLKTNDGIQREVCKIFFTDVLQITKGRLARILQLKILGELEGKDMRGKHHNRPNRISDDDWNLVEEHWESIPHKLSHCTEEKTQRKYFVDSSITLPKLFKLFKEYYQQKTGKDVRFKYDTYYRYFRKNKEYFISQPETDVDEICTEIKLKVVNPDDDIESA